MAAVDNMALHLIGCSYIITEEHIGSRQYNLTSYSMFLHYCTAVGQRKVWPYILHMHWSSHFHRSAAYKRQLRLTFYSQFIHYDSSAK